MTYTYEQWCSENKDITKLAKRLKSSCPQEYVSFYMQKVFGPEMECQKEFDWLEKKSLDIYIKTETLNFAIEYDGKFPHQGREDDDKAKNKKCRKNDVEIIRIRELNSDENKSRAGNTISYYYRNDYKNIDNAIHNLCLLINNKYDLSIDVDVDIERDKEEIIAYVQDKYYKKTIAYKWPEIKDYWYGNRESIYDVFYTSSKKYKLRCPYCGKVYPIEPGQFHNFKSVRYCENCEIKDLKTKVQMLVDNYRINRKTITLSDNSFLDRRVYDYILTHIKYPDALKEIAPDNISRELFISMGFELRQEENEEETE